MDFSKDELVEALVAALKVSNEEDPLRAAAEAEKTVRELRKFNDNLNKAQGVSALFRNALQGTLTPMEDISGALEQYDRAMDQATSAEARREIQRDRTRLVAQQNMRNLSTSFTNLGVTATKAGATLAAGLLQATNTLITGLQGNSSDFGMVGNAAKAGANVISSTLVSLGTNLTTLGKTFENAGRLGRIFGNVLGGLSKATSLASETMAKILGPAVDIVVTELEKTVRAFYDITRSGALFAGGMTEMRVTAGRASLTLESFASVLTKHSGDIAQSGLGVGRGSRMLAGVLETGGKSMRENLMRLGYNFEEQAGLVADTMRDMAGTAGPLRASQTVVAQQTEKYAENLRVIASITGEDARKKQQQAREAARDLAFQQRLASMGATQRQNVMMAMQNMSPLQQQAFKDLMVFRTIINKEAAASAAILPSFRRSVYGFAQAAEQGKLDDIETRRLNAELGDSMRNELIAAKEIGYAGAAGVTGIAGQLSKGFLGQLEFLQQNTRESIQEAETRTRAQKQTQDALTNATIAVATFINDIKIMFQGFMTDAMPMIASALKESIPIIAQELQKFAQLLKDEGGIIKLLEKTKTQVEGGIAKKGYEAAGSAAGGIAGAIGGAKIGARIGAAAQAAIPPAGIPGLIGKALAVAIPTVLMAILGAFGSELGGKAGQIYGESKEPAKPEVKPTPLPLPGNKVTPNTDIEQRAAGGPVLSGKMYLVGERGPELFKSDSPGNIVNNRDVKDMMNSLHQTASLINNRLVKDMITVLNQGSTLINNQSQLQNLAGSMLEKLDQTLVSLSSVTSKEPSTGNLPMAKAYLEREVRLEIERQVDKQPEMQADATEKILLDINNRERLFNNELKNMIQEQINLYKQNLAMNNDAQSILNDIRSYQSRLLSIQS